MRGFFYVILIFFISYIFAFVVFAEETNIIAINYKYNFFVVDKGKAHGIKTGDVYYIIRHAFQIGKVQVRKANLDVSACDVIGLVEGASLELGEEILLISKPRIGEDKIKYRWKEIPKPEKKIDFKKESSKEEEFAQLKEEAEEVESRIIEEKQFEALKAKAREIASEVEEEKEKLLVTFDFNNAHIQNVLRIIAREKKLNIIVGGDVTGGVTASFKDISVYHALDAILRSLGYTYVKEDSIIKVVPLSDTEMGTRYYIYEPSYAKVESLKESINDMLSTKGKILLDKVVNQMMIIDSPSNLNRIKEFVKSLDVPPKQVMIEAKIVDVRLTEDESLGINWEILSSKGRTPDPRMEAGFSSDGLRILKYGTIGTTELNATLELLQSNNRLNVLSEPSITTLNNKQAKIQITGKLAYRVWEEEESSEETEGDIKSFTWEEKETGITLEVTPHIAANNVILMEIKPSTKDLQEWLPDPETGYEKGYPVITTREASSEIMVAEGNTLVIGGLIKKSQSVSETGIPVLSKLPIIGIAFRRGTKSITEQELMIFITPHVVDISVRK